MDSMTLRPVGIAYTGIHDPKTMPLHGVPGKIEIFKEFADALYGIERSTHLCVFSWFHKADRTVLRSSPVKIDPGGEELGVFSLRTANRPNPVAFTVARLERVDGRILYFDRLDMVDGTPVLDIKPYSAGWDSVFCARDHHSAMIPARMSEDAGLEQLIREASNYHGERCEGCIDAAKACYDAMNIEGFDVRKAVVEAPYDVNGCLLDGVLGITKATPGNGRLKYKQGGLLTLLFDGKSIDIGFTSADNSEHVK